MEFRDSPEEASFRVEVREFIRENLPGQYTPPPFPELVEDRSDFIMHWRAALSSRGWIAPHWPKEYGGAGLSVSEQFVFNEEMAHARAPGVGGIGLNMIGPIIIRYGTDEQKSQHLPGVTSGQTQWCQGYSEPGSGSDLASLQTRAVRDGDDYVINGQKIWTSGAHRADWMFLLTRTDPDAPKHRGISMFLLDMKTPGITISPLVTLTGDHVFNQEYFDDVRVPASNMIGEENRGWYIGAALLDFERSNIASSIALRNQVADLVKFAGDWANQIDRPVSAEMKLELADRALDAEIARLISYRVVSIQKREGIPNYEASMNKLFRSEAGQRVARTSIRLVGMYGGLYRDCLQAPREGRFAHGYMASLAGTIAAGSSEINRNVIATRGLGLPRS